MTAAAITTLVWSSAQEPSPAAARTLERWAKMHEVELRPPAPSEPGEGRADDALAAESVLCERLLAEALESINAADDEAGRRLLAQVEQTLREAPALPESPWLMAERWRLGARIAARSPRWDGEARTLSQSADALEGPRAAAYGESVAASKQGRTTDPKGAAPIAVELAVRGARRYLAYWDGAAMPGSMPVLPGEHHLRVMAGAGVAWAGWISVFVAGPIELWARPVPPCSTGDLAGADLVPSAALVPRGIACTAWLIARPLDGDSGEGAIVLARCAEDRCEAPATWGEGARDTPPPLAPPHEATSGLPAWAKWTAASVIAATAAAAALWAAGAFDRQGDAATKTVYNGSGLRTP